MKASEGLRQWIWCLAGKHELVLLEDPSGGSHRFCLWCGLHL